MFDSKGKHLFYDTDFTYDLFDLHLTQITGFEVKNQTVNEAQIVVEGVFNFKDLFGRGVASYFAAAYTVHKNGITINKSATALIAPTVPDIDIFYVPKASFDDVNMKELSSFLDLYLHATLNAFNMEPTQEERKNKEAYEKMSALKKMIPTKKIKKEEFYIMAFCKDRLPPDASLEMKVTDRPKMKGKTIFETGYVYEQGWRIMLAGGTFSPNSIKDNFYVNFQYNTNSGPKSESICVGTYINQKRYDDSPKFIITHKKEATKTTTAKPKFQKNPIETCSIFLNPGNKKDARIIQTQLKKLGYYNKAIDGDFGKGSKKALSTFKKDNGLGNNNTWNLKTQKMLFKNSGL